MSCWLPCPLYRVPLTCLPVSVRVVSFQGYITRVQFLKENSGILNHRNCAELTQTSEKLRFDARHGSPNLKGCPSTVLLQQLLNSLVFLLTI